MSDGLDNIRDYVGHTAFRGPISLALSVCGLTQRNQ